MQELDPDQEQRVVSANRRIVANLPDDRDLLVQQTDSDVLEIDRIVADQSQPLGADVTRDNPERCLKGLKIFIERLNRN